MFFPKNIDFYDLFDQQAQQLKEASILMRNIKHNKNLVSLLIIVVMPSR